MSDPAVTRFILAARRDPHFRAEEWDFRTDGEARQVRVGCRIEDRVSTAYISTLDIAMNRVEPEELARAITGELRAQVVYSHDAPCDAR